MRKGKTCEQHLVECKLVAKAGISVLGIVGEYQGVMKTKLICSCEIHGTWTSTTISSFKGGISCPSCLGKTWEQHRLECEAITKTGIIILGWIGEWKGQRTKLHCRCERHGEWTTTTIQGFKRGTHGCPSCGRDATTKYFVKPDEKHVQEFKKTGAFPEGSTFTRNLEKTTKRGQFAYWNYTCPVCSNDEYVKAGVCSGVFVSYIGTLKAGRLPCRCNGNYKYTKDQWEHRISSNCGKMGYIFKGWSEEAWGAEGKVIYECPVHGRTTQPIRSLLNGHECPKCAGKTQQECYINMVYDQHTPVALKIGISKNSTRRLKYLNAHNLFQMQKVVVYEFPTIEDCKNAERVCLSELRSGVLSPRELKDGYTETVALTDYDKVVSIYQRFGGVRVDTIPEEEICELVHEC